MPVGTTNSIGEFIISGTMNLADTSTIREFGFPENTTKLFAVKVVFIEDVDDTFSGIPTGNQTTTITKNNLDGPNYIYLVLDGSTKEYTLSYTIKNEYYNLKIINNSI